MDVLSLRAILTLDKSKYEKGLGEAGSKISSFGSKFVGVMGKAAKVGAVALGAFAVSAVKVGADFDKSMSQVAATMGYTVDELHTAGSEAQKTYQRLEEAAREAGKTTAFSASEASEALNYMALAGYDADTSIEMMPKVLNLAAAGNMELATASDMVTDTQSALGLSLDETTELVDKMAKASSKSNTSVEQLGEAMLTVGGTAKMLKGGTTELSTALGILADNGTKGAEGGTALRNILTSISGSKFDKSFGALGVSAYDAEGKMRSLKDIFTDMNEAMEGMTDQEKTGIINKTFNARDLKNVNALLATTTDRWDELSGAIADSEGAAQNMAETQLDNLSGDVTILKSAFSELQITVSDLDGGALRTFVQGITEGINMLTDMINSGSFESAMEIFGKNFSKFEKYAQEGISNAINTIGAELPNIMSKVGELLENFTAYFAENAPAIAEMAANLMIKFGEGLITALPDIISAAGNILNGLLRVFVGVPALLLAKGASAVGGFILGILKKANAVATAAGKLVSNAVKGLKKMPSQFLSWAAKAVSSLVSALGKGVGKVLGAARKLSTSAVNALRSGFGKVGDIGMNLVRGIGNGITNGVGWIKGQIRSFVGNVKSFLKSLFGIHSPSTWAEDEIGLNIDKGAANGISKNAGLVKKAMKDMIPDMSAENMTASVKTAGKNMKMVYPVFNNNITVNGSEDPEKWGMSFANALEMKVRAI